MIDPTAVIVEIVGGLGLIASIIALGVYAIYRIFKSRK